MRAAATGSRNVRRLKGRLTISLQLGIKFKPATAPESLGTHKEKKPRDPTIREKFDTYRFADYKEKVIDLLMRVTRVSVETQAIVEAMKAVPH